MSDAPVAKVYHFPSQSKPGKFHEVLERTDGFLSCGCPVWIFNRRKTEPRSCSHTDQVRAGLVQPNVVHSQTDAERADRPDLWTRPKNVIDRNARRNATAVSRVYTSPREQEVMGRREEANKQKLAKIAERIKEESPMQVFPTKRKVNW